MVRPILHKQVLRYDVWTFGAQAVETAIPSSDLGLAILTDHPLSLGWSDGWAHGGLFHRCCAKLENISFVASLAMVMETLK